MVLAIAACGGATRAAAGDATDDFVRTQLKRQRIPGLALAVVKDGVVVKAEGYGVADRRTGTPVTPTTVFKIASVSKQFIAAGIMVLVQDGRLRLDGRVSGRAWSEFIAERVFRPADLLATRTTTIERGAGRAAGYSDNHRLVDADEWPAVRPGGAFQSTVLDLARWDAVLNGETILTEASRREMWTAVTLADGTSVGYGLCWFVNRPGDRREVWHSGGMPGFKSNLRRSSTTGWV